MKWPWKKRQDEDPSLVVFEVPIGTLARKTLYDSMIGDPEEVAELLEFPPISDEVAQMEREASIARLDRVSIFVPIVSVQSQVIARASVEFQNAYSETEYPESVMSAMQDAYSAVAFSAALAVLSNLLDLDIIHMAGD